MQAERSSRILGLSLEKFELICKGSDFQELMLKGIGELTLLALEVETKYDEIHAHFFRLGTHCGNLLGAATCGSHVPDLQSVLPAYIQNIAEAEANLPIAPPPVVRIRTLDLEDISPDTLIRLVQELAEWLEFFDIAPSCYVDFDLHIAPDGHAVASSIEGQAPAKIPIQVPKKIPLSLKLIEERAADADLLKEVGRALYDWLFPGAVHTLFERTEAVAGHKNTKMRLRLRVEAAEIASLPLEFLYRPLPSHFFATNPNTVLSRYLQLPLPPGRLRRQAGALHLLAIVADVPDLPRLDPDEWEAILRTALAKPLAEGQMTLRMVKQATLREINNALLEKKPHIVQFVGHGYYERGNGHLALVDEDTGKIWRVGDEQFADLFLGFDDHLGLICLATCESAASDDPQAFRGIAPKLVERGIPAVVAMQYKMSIPAAKKFLEDFYVAVAARKPVDWATQSARKMLRLRFGLKSREFATPVLYMRAKDGRVF
jgi:hypothetical protein